MTKYNLFYNNLINTVNVFNNNLVKATIGDSINNNRTLTVGQVVRYLNSGNSGIKGAKALGTNIANVFNILRNDINANRMNNRTDAVDYFEFIYAYQNFVIGSGEFKKEVSNTLN